MIFYYISYLVAGVFVGSCDYDDLCKIVAALFPSFKPETCPPVIKKIDNQ